jgi:outer membrane receptor protein involved in Fe transport
LTTGTSGFPLLLKEKHYRLTDKFTWTAPGGNHVIEAGGQLERVKTSSFLPSFKDGSFDYTTDDTTSLPFRATIAVGFNDQNGTSDALASSNGWITGGFLQDRWQVTNTFNLNLGVRYDAEFNTLVNDFITPWAADTTLRRVVDSRFLQGKRKNDLNNIAPRVSFSWDVTGRQQTFLRGGWGIMFGRVPSTYPFAEKQASVWRSYTFVFSAAPGNTATNDPAVLRQRVIAGGAAITPNLSLVSREIKTPETNMMSLGIGHQFTNDFAVNLDYVDQRSNHLYVNTSVNPSVAGVRRLTPRFANIVLWDDFGKATFQALTAGATYDRTTNEDMPLRTSLAYTLGFYKATFENFGGWVNQSWFQMQPASGDERHRVVLSGMTPLPLGFELSGVGIVASPSRFVATFGRDTNSTGLFNDDFVNPNERALRPNGGWSTWYKTVDLRLEKLFATRGGNATLSIEVFNLFNTVNWSSYGGAIKTTGGALIPSYGQGTQVYAPRQLQAGIRYKF